MDCTTSYIRSQPPFQENFRRAEHKPRARRWTAGAVGTRAATEPGTVPRVGECIPTIQVRQSGGGFTPWETRGCGDLRLVVLSQSSFKNSRFSILLVTYQNTQPIPTKTPQPPSVYSSTIPYTARLSAYCKSNKKYFLFSLFCATPCAT